MEQPQTSTQRGSAAALKVPEAGHSPLKIPRLPGTDTCGLLHFYLAA